MHLFNGYCLDTKFIRDPIYQTIELPKKFLPIIDHKLFQRLRWINQLPLEQLVYPSAVHSRFEHSLGSMYLAMMAATSLIQFSKEKLELAMREDSDFKGLSSQNANLNFILSAGACGLLHDIGHAPFSHTLEEACKYVAGSSSFFYDHETTSLFVAQKIIQHSDSLKNEIFVKKTIKVLNKKLEYSSGDISPVEQILRKLIDGKIDVDKGDYVIRDSYHCGTPYGVYDIERLWRHIALNDNYELAPNHKSAIEAWSLLLCRYKMHQNVYKHHIRNITDALLIEIISDVIEKRTYQDLIPVSSNGDVSNENLLTKFTFWTDDNFIKILYDLGSPGIQGKIENFKQRSLYKRDFSIDLITYENLCNKKSIPTIILEVKKIQKELEKQNCNFNFIVYVQTIPPVLSNDVQNEIKVIENDTSIAKFLGFDTSETKEATPIIWIFSPHKSHTKMIQDKLENILQKLNTSLYS
ncbi:HD domain-containing protein [Geovibrio thiophilus]|uniref:HD domain-containing protein n=1 Tax=Geovibrio thiophilus TaxID=139438 RepID=A0A410JVB3_9BACT|nr:HD domain-containing protein [Geovibrio thiophilus]QAR32150.1 HD domain-containing protein [Geovibrio thiophilus]